MGTTNERLKELRQLLGYTQLEFGQCLGCSNDVIANLESNRTEPKDVFLKHAAEVFNMNYEDFFEDRPLPVTRETLQTYREFTETYRKLPTPLLALANEYIQQLYQIQLQCQDYGQWMKEYDGLNKRKLLQKVIHTKGVKISLLTYASAIPKEELYQIFTGAQMKRDQLFQLAFGLSLSVSQMQAILTVYGHPILDIDDKRDFELAYSLHTNRDIYETNLALGQKGLAEIFSHRS